MCIRDRPQNGQRMKISYRNGNTTVFETQGLDGEISRTGDNRKLSLIHIFMEYGKIVEMLETAQKL